MRTSIPAFVVVLMMSVNAGNAAGQTVTKQAVPGVVNFARAETTVACGGAVTPEGLKEIKKLGFVSVFNLRLPNEPGNDVPAEEAAAKAEGLKFAHIPVNSSAMEPAVADKFLETIMTPGYQPAFIHCGGGGRAATMWFIKRVVVDGWDIDKATVEATALGMGTGRIKDFALEYIKTRQKK
jgi:uncharacterized protein (TIGR01244 family)